MRKLPFVSRDPLPLQEVPGGWIRFGEGIFSDHRERMRVLLDSLPLRAEKIRIYGATHPLPRLTSWHGDASYRYSGKTFKPEPWTDELVLIRDRLEELTGTRFNSVLANYYRDGSDTVSWHADDEPELGPEIASVSLGARRRFMLKHRETGTKVEFLLGEGNVLVMGGALQKHWVHSVPRTKKKVGARLNLTFRVVKS